MLEMIVAVVVTYQPGFIALARLLDAIKHQVRQTIVVDNGSTVDVNAFLAGRNDQSVHCLCLRANYGVAAAQNAGIVWAKEAGAHFVVLFDQDSKPALDMIGELLEAHRQLETQGANVAAVGCRHYWDGNQQQSGFVRFSRPPGSRVVSCAGNQRVVECDFVISSGTLIPMSIIDKLGMMDDRLFIDHVDTEWCLRARSKGYKIYGACFALMQHDLGMHRKHIWFLRWRDVSVHMPFRYYYMVRNSMLLRRRDYPDRAWRMFDLQRLLMLTLIFGLCVPGRVARLRMMLKGFRDGLNDRTGKLVE